MFTKLLESLYKVVDPWGDYIFNNNPKGMRNLVKDRLLRAYLWTNRQAAIRYIPVTSEIKHLKCCETGVLEVGSGSLGLARYTKRDIVGADIKVVGPRYQNMSLVQADARTLPFSDDAFEFVCSLDMIEHLPKEKRADVILEICRVARKKVVIGVPCSKETEQLEDRARAVYWMVLKNPRYSKQRRERLVSENRALLEHSEFGLPSTEEIRDWIKGYERQSGIRVRIREVGNESRYVWYLGVLANMKYSYLRWVVTSFGFIVLFPFIAKTGLGGYYRTLFFVEKYDVN
jgi:hypothetical protein